MTLFWICGHVSIVNFKVNLDWPVNHQFLCFQFLSGRAFSSARICKMLSRIWVKFFCFVFWVWIDSHSAIFRMLLLADLSSLRYCHFMTVSKVWTFLSRIRAMEPSSGKRRLSKALLGRYTCLQEHRKIFTIRSTKCDNFGDKLSGEVFTEFLLSTRL